MIKQRDYMKQIFILMITLLATTQYVRGMNYVRASKEKNIIERLEVNLQYLKQRSDREILDGLSRAVEVIDRVMDELHAFAHSINQIDENSVAKFYVRYSSDCPLILKAFSIIQKYHEEYNNRYPEKAASLEVHKDKSIVIHKRLKSIQKPFDDCLKRFYESNAIQCKL